MSVTRPPAQQQIDELWAYIAALLERIEALETAAGLNK